MQCVVRHIANYTLSLVGFCLLSKIRKRFDEEFHVLYENASQLDITARSQHVTEGINRICKEHEEGVRLHFTDKGYGANLFDYIKMSVFYLPLRPFFSRTVAGGPSHDVFFAGLSGCCTNRVTKTCIGFPTTRLNNAEKTEIPQIRLRILKLCKLLRIGRSETPPPSGRLCSCHSGYSAQFFRSKVSLLAITSFLVLVDSFCRL